MELELDSRKWPDPSQKKMSCLLDTHFLLWILAGSKRLRQFPWLEQYRPWDVSPICFLEIQLLSESGRIRLSERDLPKAIAADSRFVIDEPSFVSLVQKSLELSWARDPFDRLLVAHSLVRRKSLCSVDSLMLENHRLIPPELQDR